MKTFKLLIKRLTEFLSKSLSNNLLIRIGRDLTLTVCYIEFQHFKTQLIFQTICFRFVAFCHSRIIMAASSTQKITGSMASIVVNLLFQCSLQRRDPDVTCHSQCSSAGTVSVSLSRRSVTASLTVPGARTRLSHTAVSLQ